MMRALVLLLVLAACPSAPVKPKIVPEERERTVDRDARVGIITELKSEILTSYERDEAPQIESSMISPVIGTIRVGVGPGDVLVNEELERAPSRWPLDIPAATLTEVRSKKLEIHLARDASSAWATDEVSWRIHVCNKIAVIPLRMTAMYARDGDRWVLVFEHVSFARTPAPVRDGTLRGRTLRDARIDNDIHDDLSRVLAPVLSRQIAKSPQVVSQGPEAMILGADIDDEWSGAAVLQARVAAGNLRAEDRRVGVVGRTVENATMAYWVGNFVADLPARPGVPAGKVRFRGTFVFEKRGDEKIDCGKKPKDCEWLLVQGHVSQSIDDGPDPDPSKRDFVDLGSLVFGTSMISPKPLELTCDEQKP